MADKGITWIRFLRQYGPIAHNDNMYDEHIWKSAKRAGIQPIEFVHPLEPEILSLFESSAGSPVSVILTGTAGDGKTNLCRKVWQLLGGDDADWGTDDIYHTKVSSIGGKPVTVHIIRDLTALPQKDDKGRYSDKNQLLQMFCCSLFDSTLADVFLIAANDGQLIESWQRLEKTEDVLKVRYLLDYLLVEDFREREGIPLKLFNLSRVPSADLLDLALPAFLSHPAWDDCYSENRDDFGFFGIQCPIRHNYELLKNQLVQFRLRSLFQLCDCNDLHIPIRRILLLLSNAVMGHPDSKDRLMRSSDVAEIIQRGTVSKASLFNNIFGGNLTETRRESLEVFEYLNRFRIGYETSNRIDNILIFGEADENLRPYFEDLVRSDTFYGAGKAYYAAQHEYIEGSDEDDTNSLAFLELLVSQRRGLFFNIPEKQEQELSLWELTVFKYAGEYLSRIIRVLNAGGRVERPILARLIKGLNRVFVGMLVNTDRELILATGLSFSNAKVSRMLKDRISVSPRLNERVEINMVRDKPALTVYLSDTNQCVLQLNLIRYEFLSRVAEGALPSSFSKGCYEDILAFKSKVLSGLADRQELQGVDNMTPLTFRLLNIDDSGNLMEDVVEITND